MIKMHENNYNSSDWSSLSCSSSSSSVGGGFFGIQDTRNNNKGDSVVCVPQSDSYSEMEHYLRRAEEEINCAFEELSIPPVQYRDSNSYSPVSYVQSECAYSWSYNRYPSHSPTPAPQPAVAKSPSPKPYYASSVNFCSFRSPTRHLEPLIEQSEFSDFDYDHISTHVDNYAFQHVDNRDFDNMIHNGSQAGSAKTLVYSPTPATRRQSITTSVVFPSQSYPENRRSMSREALNRSSSQLRTPTRTMLNQTASSTSHIPALYSDPSNYPLHSVLPPKPKPRISRKPVDKIYEEINNNKVQIDHDDKQKQAAAAIRARIKRTHRNLTVGGRTRAELVESRMDSGDRKSSEVGPTSTPIVALRTWGSESEFSRLDFGNPDSVNQWTQQILAEIKSIPDSPMSESSSSFSTRSSYTAESASSGNLTRRSDVDIQKTLNDAYEEMVELERSIHDKSDDEIIQSIAKDTTDRRYVVESVDPKSSENTDRNTWPIVDELRRTNVSTEMAMSQPDVNSNVTGSGKLAAPDELTPTPSLDDLKTPTPSPRASVQESFFQPSVESSRRSSAFKPYRRKQTLLPDVQNSKGRSLSESSTDPGAQNNSRSSRKPPVVERRKVRRKRRRSKLAPKIDTGTDCQPEDWIQSQQQHQRMFSPTDSLISEPEVAPSTHPQSDQQQTSGQQHHLHTPTDAHGVKRRSVHGVVASIIKQVEGTVRGSSHSESSSDCPAMLVAQSPGHLEVSVSGSANSSPDTIEAFTQTTPYSLSRSSSFTWIAEDDCQSAAESPCLSHRLNQFHQLPVHPILNQSAASHCASTDVQTIHTDDNAETQSILFPTTDFSDCDSVAGIGNSGRLAVNPDNMQISVNLSANGSAQRSRNYVCYGQPQQHQITRGFGGQTHLKDDFGDNDSLMLSETSVGAVSTDDEMTTTDNTIPITSNGHIYQVPFLGPSSPVRASTETKMPRSTAHNCLSDVSPPSPRHNPPIGRSRWPPEQNYNQNYPVSAWPKRFANVSNNITTAPPSQLSQQLYGVPDVSSDPFFEESIYDNLHMAAAPTSPVVRQTPPQTLASLTDKSPRSDYGKAAELTREFSVTSGVMADSESSPTSPEQTSFSPDALQGSLNSFPSTDGSFELASQERLNATTGEQCTSLANSLPTLDLISNQKIIDRSDRRLLQRLQESLGSAGNLTGTNSNSYEQHLSKKEQVEFDVKEACKWLRQRGFPQYVVMFETNKFPINLNRVEKEHSGQLNSEEIEAVCRRLTTLNCYAKIKADIGTVPLRQMADDVSDDEYDALVLSKQWNQDRRSKQYYQVFDFGNTAQVESDKLTENRLSRGRQLNRNATLASADDARAQIRARKANHSVDPEMIETEDAQRVNFRRNSKLQRSSSERLKDGAKALAQRFRPRHARKKSVPPGEKNRNPADMVISGPYDVEHKATGSPPSMRMLKTIPSHSSNDSPPSTLEKTNDNRRSTSYAEPIPDPPATAPLPRAHHGKRYQYDAERRRGLVQVTGNGRESHQPIGSNPYLAYQSSNLLSAPSASENDVVRTNHVSYHNHSINSSLLTTTTDSSPEVDNARALMIKVDRSQMQGSSAASPSQLSRGSHNAGITPNSQQTLSSLDSSDTDSPYYWQRRDSGMGSSLSRSPTSSNRPRVRWNSFSVQNRESTYLYGDVHLDSLSVNQMDYLKMRANLKRDAKIESRMYNSGQKPSGVINRNMQRLLRRMKSPEPKENQVFGVPLNLIAQRTGQPLPQCILNAMRFVRHEASTTVGLFRRSGVRSRIAQLRQLCEQDRLGSLDSGQVFDAADMVKQYFRELPEPLLTAELSDALIRTVLETPENQRMEIMQICVICMPDESREVVQSLLYFLHDIAENSQVNQMTADNLSVCFAPSLFQLSHRVVGSPGRRHKTITSGLPNERDLKDNQAAQVCLTEMIKNSRKLFCVPDCLLKETLTWKADTRPKSVNELIGNGIELKSFFDNINIVDEHREKWKGWVTEGCSDGVEISYKKSKSLNEQTQLKLVRCWTDVEAPPSEVLRVVLNERQDWDVDLLKKKVLRQMTSNCDICQYVCNDMPPHPTRDYLVMRYWETKLGAKHACVLVETSVDIREVEPMGAIRALLIDSQYLIERSPGATGLSRITHICRYDTRGRSKEWYSKVFGYISANYIAKIRDILHKNAEGRETKV